MAETAYHQIVGIGASAGGLEALKDFVSAIPQDTGMSFVIVQHLSPDHPSLMDRLLQEVCAIPVSVIEDYAPIEPNNVYLSPPAVSVGLKDGQFNLKPYDRNVGLQMPINAFFGALADHSGTNAFGIVLSGTGTDGTSGIRKIKAAGGIVAAQQLTTALFAGMPDSAIATGLTDFILPPSEIPAQLTEIAEFRGTIPDQTTAEAILTEVEKKLPELLDLLIENEFYDFKGYKTGTLSRRVLRRMSLHQCSDVDDYVEILNGSIDESRALVQDFLIGVTRFFRDPESFKVLEHEIIPELIARQPNRLRIWVPGCSSGEEVYSLAILVNEALIKAGKQQSFQIFGTDIDVDALAQARAGVYARDAVADVDPRLVDKYFVSSNGDVLVIPQLRESCVFAPHNILTDPPYSRIDLISFRNVLIYLTTEAQNQTMPRLHYALSPGGYLVLGPSENPSFSGNHFLDHDRRNRIFKRNDALHSGFDSAGIAMLQNSGAIGQDYHRLLNVTSERQKYTSQEAQLEQLYITRFADPFIAVGPSNDVLYMSETMTRFIRPSKGAVVSSLNRMLMPDLRIAVQSAVTRARESGEEAIETDIILKTNGTSEVFDIHAIQAAEDDATIFVVLKEIRVREQVVAPPASGAEARELEIAWQRLQALESSNAESEQKLKSANEELLSMNEELQSSNEELDTSREELQSINEELETINAELVNSNANLSQSLSDMRNFFESANLAILFLDKSLDVRLFTPETERLFSIKERDIGRPISDLSSTLQYAELEDDVRKVISDLLPVKREVTLGDSNQIYEARLKPYRTLDDRLDGCIITFVDITENKRAEAELRERNSLIDRQLAELEAVYHQSPVGMILFDKDLKYVRVNSKVAELNASPVEAHLGKTMAEVVPHQAAGVTPILNHVLETGELVLQHEVTASFGIDQKRTAHLLFDFFPVRADGEVFGVAAAFTDVTELVNLRKEKETALERVAQSEQQFREILDKTPFAVAIHTGPELTCIYANDAFREWHGQGDPVGKSAIERMGLDPSEAAKFMEEVLESGQPKVGVAVLLPRMMPDGHVKDEYHTAVAIPYRNENGDVIGVTAMSLEVTDQVLARERQDLMISELRHRVQNLLAVVQAVAAFSAINAEDKDDLLDKLQDRLEAIARANTQLTSLTTENHSLHEILDLELDQLGPEARKRIMVTGENPTLSAEKASFIALVLHELKNNALKYGALADDAGSIEFSCEQASSGGVTLHWAESSSHLNLSGPPEQAGFGTMLLTELASKQLDAKVNQEFKTDGLKYTLTFSP